MKILIARMNHETNTFSPVPTPLSAFGQNGANAGPSFNDDAFNDNKGMQTAMAAFIDAAAREGAQIVTPVSAAANPSGPVEAAAYDAICDAILAAASGCDAVMLDLHGAMVAENSNDGEGDLLERVRAALPNAPIAVALDLHGNVTQKMIDNADVIVSFKTYPHVDMYETGAHAARLLFDLIHGKAKPVIAWRQPPLLTHTLRSATAEGAMKRAVDAARAAEAEAAAAACDGGVGESSSLSGLAGLGIPSGGSGGCGKVGTTVAEENEEDANAGEDVAAIVYPGHGKRARYTDARLRQLRATLPGDYIQAEPERYATSHWLPTQAAAGLLITRDVIAASRNLIKLQFIVVRRGYRSTFTINSWDQK